MSALTHWIDSPELQRFGPVRAAAAGDAVAGVTPHLVLEPLTPEAMAGALAWATRERLATVIRGHGTKLTWGRRPATLDVVLATTRLNDLVAHRHGDLTATIQAGARLVDVNQILAREGQWLPLDSAFEDATIGGVVASNDAGPLRHRYGTPRDLLIGITLALTDGRVVKSGGHVVKNVAGYDLGKLVSGSFGTLAVIVDATFKLSPLMPASQTLAVRYERDEALVEAVARLLGSQLEPTAVDLHVSRGGGGPDAVRRLLVRFATSPEATAAQTEAARTLLRGDAETMTGGLEAALWAEQVRRPWAGTGGVVRLSWLPAALAQVLALVADVQKAASGRVTLSARAAVGAGLMSVEAEERGFRSAVDLLRARNATVSNVVVVEQGPAAGAIDVWGPPPSAAAVLQSVKQTFDPAGILNAGRGPL